MGKTYSTYYDIEANVKYVEKNKIPFLIVVSEDEERGCGKTYSMCRLLLNRYLETGTRFVTFTRKMKQLAHTAEGMFGQYIADNYPNGNIYEVLQGNGIYTEIWFEQTSGEDKIRDLIGFTIPLKSAGDIKLISSLFSSKDVGMFWMDEFMPTDNKYLPDEPLLMRNIYKSVNRKMLDIPIVLTANTITLGNPYFTYLHINKLLQTNTRKLCTENFLYEKVEVEGLREKHQQSGIDRAFNMKDRNSNVWINDDNSLVCKPENIGRGYYICTLVYGSNKFGVLEYNGSGFFYITRKVDTSCKYVYSLKSNGNLDVPLLRTSPLLQKIRNKFFSGQVRVSDGGIQRDLMEIFG